MSFPRSIVHLDADAFFASVEQAADPRLRGQPIAVGGEKRGIIASASYEARKFGIYTPMPTTMARRLCPRLILLPGDFDKYELFSRLMFSYAYDFTPDVEIGSIDEGYFDLTGTRQPAVGIAQTIRRAIRQSLKLPVSEGIAGNKLVSQIASKLKKPSAFEVVANGGEAEFLSPLANKWLPGVGPQTAGQLNAAGLAFIGQIAQTPIDLLNLLVGSPAPQLRRFALGIDERPLIPVRAPAKSYGEQETFAADTTDEPFLEATLRRMADKLMAKVREDGKSIRTLTVKVRYNDMDEEQASESLNEPTDLETDLYARTSALLRKAWRRRVSLRLVSLKLSNIYDGRFRSGLALDVTDRRHTAQQRLAGTVDELRQKFGRAVLLRGHDFMLRAKGGRGEEPGDGGERAESREKKAENRKQKTVIRSQRAEDGNPRTEASHQESGKSKIKNQKSKTQCVPLNVHSYYSFLDSTLSIKAIIDLAKRHELPAIALTDRNNLHGAVEFAQAAAEAGIKPIIGAELDWDGRRVCLYVQNQTGYQNLCRILNAMAAQEQRPETRNQRSAVRNQRSERSNASAQESQFAIFNSQFPILNSALEQSLPTNGRDAFHRVPDPLRKNGDAGGTRPYQIVPGPHAGGFAPPILLTSAATIQNFTDGLLAVSPSAELAQFFPGRFYLEISSLDAYENARRQSTNPPLHHSITPSLHHSATPSLSPPTNPPIHQSTNPSIHPSTNPSIHHRSAPLPCVASFPVHYELPSDRWKYNIVQSIRTLTLLRQPHPQKRLAGDYHFRPAAEMRELFAAHPELLAHSLEIADRCAFTFSLGKPQFPSYPPPDGSTPAAFLRRLVMDGLQRRYPDEHARLRPQLEEELAIIMEVGYEEYFLVMWGILQECRQRGIEWITRGSAADSLACYCLEISGVCPIRFDLYFRRFLNKERMALNKLPDIDVDFPHDRKDDVIDLIFEKYGPARAAVVGGFSTFQSRSAFAEVAKVLGVSEYQVRRLTERLPHFSQPSELAEAVAGTLECRDLPLDQEPYSTALQMAQFLDGFPRYPKMHPCGLVLSRQDMDEITPCFISAKGYPTTHFDMDSVEAVGLVKMDILAQGGLAVMRDVAEMRDFHLPSTAGPFDDSEIWDLISSGSARAVHHIESPAMISLCRMCNVRDIGTLIAIVSVIRPGAANECRKMEFARRYQNPSLVRYPHPSLKPCLHSTYGLVVYEEHILQICEAFAGLPPGRADVLRRALGKNKTELIDQIQTEFASCARRLGRTESEIDEVWNLVAGFRGYAFCKAHSTAYGVEAYQSAWLKLHYPAEFMAAVLTNGKGFYSPLVYILECHRLGIPLLPPSVNEPGPNFRVTGQKKIRVPVLLVKGLTARTKDTILRERPRGPFTSLTNFFLRVRPLPEEMEALIRVGAFDEFGQPRTSQYWEFKGNAECQSQIKNQKSKIKIGQLQLLPPADFDRLPTVPLVEPGRLDRLRAEEELLGYAVSGHPLELFPDIAWDTYCPVNRLGRHLGKQIVTCGLVIEQRLFHQVTGEPMKFITIADRTGVVETELFAKTYQSYGLNTVRYRVLEVTATVEPFENGRGHTLRVLRAGKPRTKDKAAP
ncbi:MAG TPA: DNA polymerase III subunit alpha [Candidatus Acidoferrum sp.]|jgi:DNA-directed DNA polymerase III PolC|nr:DNA polymerase III subunit alpha [Candidatus Acidoferrum sp.]